MLIFQRPQQNVLKRKDADQQEQAEAAMPSHRARTRQRNSRQSSADAASNRSRLLGVAKIPISLER